MVAFDGLIIELHAAKVGANKLALNAIDINIDENLTSLFLTTIGKNLCFVHIKTTVLFEPKGCYAF